MCVSVRARARPCVYGDSLGKGASFHGIATSVANVASFRAYCRIFEQVIAGNRTSTMPLWGPVNLSACEFAVLPEVDLKQCESWFFGLEGFCEEECDDLDGKWQPDNAGKEDYEDLCVQKRKSTIMGFVVTDANSGGRIDGYGTAPALSQIGASTTPAVGWCKSRTARDDSDKGVSCSPQSSGFSISNYSDHAWYVSATVPSDDDAAEKDCLGEGTAFTVSLRSKDDPMLAAYQHTNNAGPGFGGRESRVYRGTFVRLLPVPAVVAVTIR